MLYRQRPALPVAGLLHRSTVDPTVDRGGHSRGIVQVDLMRQIMADRARAVPAAAEPEEGRPPRPEPDPPAARPPRPAVRAEGPRGKTWNSRRSVARGPVVLVFYLGSTCMACVTHLVELDLAISRFRDRGARVLAISADSPEFSRERIVIRRFPDSAPQRPRSRGRAGLRRLESRSQAATRTTASRCTAPSSSTVTAWSAGPMSAIVPSGTSRRC